MAGIDECNVRADVVAYLTSSIPDLPGMADTDVVIRWRPVGEPTTGTERARDVHRWPTHRTDTMRPNAL